MKKTLGIALLLLVVCVITGAVNPNFLKPYNAENLVVRSSLHGILAIGAAFVIVTGGIDLSIGSVVGLIGTLLPWLLMDQGWGVPSALAVCGLVALAIGLSQGLLVTRMKLQPFVVTLCGLMLYRGIARWLTHDNPKGFQNGYESLRNLAIGRIEWLHVGGYRLPNSSLILITVAVLAGIFFSRSVPGRHMIALGRNEEAARYSGIRTERLLLLAYVVCSLLAGVGGVLFALDVNSVAPDKQGNFYELYAIAAAVLGGCSLRGGEISVLGVVIGAVLMRVLYNSIILLNLPDQLEPVIIGMVLLLGVSADEVVRRWRAAGRGS